MHEYERISRVIQFVHENRTDQPDLATLARVAGLSRFHFNRMFSRWAGVTPQRYLQSLTSAHAKQLLQNGESVLDAALETGLSGPGRLHDLCVNLEAASPGEIKSGGRDWVIRAGFVDTPFGICLVAESARGICHLSFAEAADASYGDAAIRSDWPNARIHWDDAAAAKRLSGVFRKVEPDKPTPRPALRAIVRGTRFQLQVWRALLRIPHGALISYGRLAEALGNRQAARAVGTAVGQNPIAYLIPCHRVIRETGEFGGYRWGSTRKKALIAWETPILNE